MPTILITNDDGITAPGLLALKRGLAPLGRIVVLAPERNWSASSHIRTLYHPLRIQPQRLEDGSEAWSCSGSPADCVALAMAGALDGVHPDLVVAGINAGHNLGIDVAYSGTVACAREAVIKMAPGIAVSSIFPTQGDITHAHASAGRVARQVAAQVLERGLPPNTLLNVNVPGLAYDELKGTKVTRTGGRYYDGDKLIERPDPYGHPYYWLGGASPTDLGDDGTDVHAVFNGYVSVSPISLDTTHYAFLEALGQWSLDGALNGRLGEQTGA